MAKSSIILKSFLIWMQNFKKINPIGNIIIFRETSPSFFDTSDGTFIKRRPGLFSSITSNKDGEFYKCVSVKNKIENAFENILLDKILKDLELSYQEDNNLNSTLLQPLMFIAKFYHYVLPFNNMLRGGHTPNKTTPNDMDCVHFCSFAPNMWLPHWIDLLSFINYDQDNKQDEINKNNIILTTDHIENIFTPYSAYNNKINQININIYHDIYIDIISNKAFYLNSKGNSLHIIDSDSTSNCIFQGLCQESSFEIIMKQYNSKLHFYPFNYEINKKIRIINDSNINSLMISSLSSKFNDDLIFCGLPLLITNEINNIGQIQNVFNFVEIESVIKESWSLSGQRNKFLYLINSNYSKSLIPNYDTLNAMKLNHKKFISLSGEQFHSIRLGEKLLPLDF